MKWFSGTPAGALATPPAPAVGHRSLALKAFLDGLRPDRRHAVLDLGPPLGANIDFLSALGCRVRIADLHASVAAEPVESREAAAFGPLVARMLPLAPGEAFDGVLAWDVLNYLRVDQVATLIRWLGPALSPRTLMLVLMETHARMPPAPLRQRIVDRQTLLAEGPLEPSRVCPRYNQPELARMLPGFRVAGSFLLRNGTHEYLFVRD